MRRTRAKIPAGLRRSTAPVKNRAAPRGTSFEVRSLAQNAVEIDLFDEIGYWGVTAAEFRAALRGAGDVVIRVNSPGGDVFDGLEMYNTLADHPHRVQVHITALAASAASFIAMAADPGELRIAPQAFVMIHNAWTVAVGDRHEFTHHAGILEQIDTGLVEIYSGRNGAEAAEIAEMMDAETWLRGAEAVDAGFSDAIYETGDGDVEGVVYDLSRFAHTPAELLARFDSKPADPTLRDSERALREAGHTRARARAILSSGFNADTRDAVDNAGTREAVDELDTLGEEYQPFLTLLEDLKQ